MKIRAVFRFCFVLCLALPLVGAVPTEVPPEKQGFDAARLGRLDAAIQKEIDDARLAGAVMVVLRDGQPVRFRAYGMQDIEAKTPMPTDAIFRIASMSKAITTVAALMLYEEGKFQLNDRVDKYLPEFANPVVAVAPPAGSPESVKYVTVKAKTPMLVRHVMTHTAGLTYGDFLAIDDYKKAQLYGWYLIDQDTTIGEAMKRLAKLPLSAHPGEAFNYGYGTDLLGYLVEVWSGMPLDKFIAERITGPLGMKDTSFYLDPAKASRLATVYSLDKGKFTRGDQGHFVEGPRKLFSGGAGLLSTAGDYTRFLQMLANGGELDGVRLLAPTTVRLAHQNFVGDLFNGGKQGFGLGYWINDRPGAFGEAIGEGSYGWGSAYFPQYLIDPKEKLVVLLMTQLRPATGSDLNQRVKNLTYQALIK
jgi:CubicO group peptidase (beta-lactamase class C family)